MEVDSPEKIDPSKEDYPSKIRLFSKKRERDIAKRKAEEGVETRDGREFESEKEQLFLYLSIPFKKF